MFGVTTFAEKAFAESAARTIACFLPAVGTFVLTGGRTAAAVYRRIAEETIDWSGIEIFFSDERCVPPTDDNSNYRMVKEKLLTIAAPAEVFRIRGEDPPEVAAEIYNQELAGVDNGFDLAMLGMGAEGHIGALFPHSPHLQSNHLAVAVDRPDGMQGITMTPSALMKAKKIFIVERGEEKAEAVARAVKGNEPAAEIPVRALADHPNVTFLIDDAAASRL